MCLFCVLQEQRERKVTVDEVPSGVYLYPEEEAGVDSVYGSFPGQASTAVFEEAQKEILKLMKIEVCLCGYVYHFRAICNFCLFVAIYV